MKIGAYELYPVETGRFALDGGAMFGVIPKNLWHRANRADESNRIELALRSLLLKSEKRLVLIDTGIGHKYDEKFAHRYKIDHSEYTLINSLAQYGVQREDITDIILTHLHFDHAGGTTILDNNTLMLTFPNATHYIQSQQWDWAVRPSEKDRASFIKDNFLPLDGKSILNKLNGPSEILPGINIEVKYGHTPAMQTVKIYDEVNTLIHCADLIPTSSHITLPWIMAYDNKPIITIEEKRKLLKKVVAEDWILFFEHDPLHHAGRVQITDKGYALKQVVSLL